EVPASGRVGLHRETRRRRQVALGASGMAVAVIEQQPLFAALQRIVVPLLRTYPSIRVWHCGCPVANEAYWTGMALFEANALERSRIFVTDPDVDVLTTAALAGEQPGLARLLERMTFFQCDVETDSSFNEFQLIVARGVITNRAYA